MYHIHTLSCTVKIYFGIMTVFFTMSGTVMSPYAKTIALPGVETGKMYEKLTAIATGNIK